MVGNSGGIATLALSYVIQAFPDPTRHRRQLRRATALLALAATIVRAETVLLLLGLVVALAVKERYVKTGHAVIRDVLLTAVVAGMAGMMMSVAVDTFFWRQWLSIPRDVSSSSTGTRAILERALQGIGFGRWWIWPEAWGVVFNVVEGKSELWGVSPPRLPSSIVHFGAGC